MIRETEQRALPVFSPLDLEPLIQQIHGARIVMLGESTHGTAEFYHWRRLISQWLIVKHGFNFVAVEGEWPSCRLLDNYVRLSQGPSARETLECFHRWPTWMWANTEIARFGDWLKEHNARLPDSAPKVGFQGLDIYSLFESRDVVLRELEKINPFQARQAALRYSCFDPYGRDELAYAGSLMRLPEGCADQAVHVLKELLQLHLEGNGEKHQALVDAQQNARIVRNAEHYYRAMVHSDDESWNIRDQHMMETLEWLLEKQGPRSRAIVWAHNTHIGDYRATDMHERGIINLGGLARQRFNPGEVALVGFGTYEGHVTASSAWGGPIKQMSLPPAQDGSYEAAFHQATEGVGSRHFVLTFKASEPPREPFITTRGHRAVGVVYDPAHDRFGHYVPTQLAQRYDAFFFVDQTTALQPLVLSVDRGEFPETWPLGQ